MNRLKGLSCYLSGPIDFALDNGKKWRDDITPFFEEKNVKVFNPLKHMFYGTDEVDTVKRPKMKQMLEEGRFDELRDQMKDLNHWDLRAIDLSSFMIVNYDTSIHLCGTIEEISICNKQQKPILLVCKNGKKKLPSWLYGRLPHEHFFETFCELKKFITSIDSNPEHPWTKADKKRFLFFDGDHMKGEI